MGNELVEGMQRFVDSLCAGEPIAVTEVKRVYTPDGPMHVRTKKIVRYRKAEDEQKTS